MGSINKKGCIYMNNSEKEIEFQNKSFEEYSGNFRIRMPKSLHKKLSEQAEKEGISLNQYCIHVLSQNLPQMIINKQRLNYELIKIRDNIGTANLEKLIDEVNKLHTKVTNLKPVIMNDISKLMGDRTKITLSEEEDLEYNYPVLGGSAFGEKLPRLKLPTIKLVIEPKNDFNLAIPEIGAALDEIKNQSRKIIITEVNVDELNKVFNLTNKEMRSKVIYFLDEDLEKVAENAKLIRSKLESLNRNKELELKFYPSYIWVNLKS